MVGKIGGKLYTLKQAKANHQATIRELQLGEIAAVIREGYGDTALVAELMGYAQSTILSWIHTGKIKATKGPDNRWWIPLEQFLTLLGFEEGFKQSPKARIGQVARPRGTF